MSTLFANITYVPQIFCERTVKNLIRLRGSGSTVFAYMIRSIMSRLAYFQPILKKHCFIDCTWRGLIKPSFQISVFFVFLICVYQFFMIVRKNDFSMWTSDSLQRQPHYENTPIQIYWKFYNPKRENFQIKNSDIFHISAQNINCGYSLEPPRRGGSNEYPQSMFWAEIRKIMYTPVNPSFTI